MGDAVTALTANVTGLLAPADRFTVATFVEHLPSGVRAVLTVDVQPSVPVRSGVGETSKLGPFTPVGNFKENMATVTVASVGAPVVVVDDSVKSVLVGAVGLDLVVQLDALSGEGSGDKSKSQESGLHRVGQVIDDKSELIVLYLYRASCWSCFDFRVREYQGFDGHVFPNYSAIVLSLARCWWYM